jgi:predicted component of type VI protein secretion system
MLFLHIVNGLLENNLSYKHIEWCFKIMIMQHDGTINNFKVWVFQTSVQIECPFMHHHI